MDFREFPKIARYSREIVVTEKIDGTNASITISPDDESDAERGTATAAVDGLLLRAGSRNRWITPDADNFGFASWVFRNAAALKWLGIGTHFGEWWGSGIQRGYGLEKGEKRFSLFNVARWSDDEARPKCCHVVPVIHRDAFDGMSVARIMDDLRANGSYAAPGFMKPEGIVIFHAQGNVAFKKTFEKDDAGKGREPVATELSRAA
jgi:hypothetical protein